MSNSTCYLNENVSDDTDGHAVVDGQFKEQTCLDWCPSLQCEVCTNLTSFSNMIVKSCGDDNKANQMGLQNSCRKVGTGKDKGLGCVCEEAECYCYCIIQGCICNGGLACKISHIIQIIFSVVAIFVIFHLI